MTSGVLGATIGGLVGLVIGLVGAKAVNAMLDRQIEAASGEDAGKFKTVRRLAGPIVVLTTIAEIAVVGYVGVEVLAG